MDTDDEITELAEIQSDRVDGVMAPANGIPFLVLKSIAPGDVAKAEESTKTQNDLPDSAFAYVEPGGDKDDDGNTTPRSLRHFPVHDKAHAQNALARAPQSEFGDKAMPKIVAAAKKFGIDTGDNVAKADDMVDCPTCAGKGTIMDGHRDCPDCDNGKVTPDKATTLAKADDTTDTVPADDGMPGSKSWEAADSARLQDATQLCVQLKQLLTDAAGREQTEGQTVDPSDLDQAWTLQDACSMLDWLLGTVAAMAATEQHESDMAPDTADGVVKAGKTISTASAAKIKSARDHMVQGAAHLTDLLGEGEPDQEVEVTKEELDAMLTARDDALLVKMAELIKPAEAAPVVDGEVTKAADETKSATTDTTAAAPAVEVLKAADLESVLKSVMPEMIKAAVTPLEARLAVVENQPRPAGPMFNGASPVLRDQTGNAGPDDLTKALAGHSPDEQEEIREAWSRRNLAAMYTQAGFPGPAARTA